MVLNGVDSDGFGFFVTSAHSGSITSSVRDSGSAKWPARDVLSSVHGCYWLSCKLGSSKFHDAVIDRVSEVLEKEGSVFQVKGVDDVYDRENPESSDFGDGCRRALRFWLVDAWARLLDSKNEAQLSWKEDAKLRGESFFDLAKEQAAGLEDKSKVRVVDVNVRPS